jgi:hypothetical protein
MADAGQPTNFWQFLLVVWTGFWNNKTKALGIAQACAAYLCGASVIPESHLKYWLAASGLLTLLVGFSNGSRKADPSPPLPPTSEKPKP